MSSAQSEDLGNLQGQQALQSIPRTFLPLQLPSLLGYLIWSLNLGDFIFLIQVKMGGVPSHNKAICVVGPVDWDSTDSPDTLHKNLSLVETDVC